MSAIRIEAGYGEINPIFHLKKITQDEERKFYASLADLAQQDDPDATSDHQHQAVVAALKEWSAGRLTKAEGDGSALFFDDPKADAGADIDRYLSDVAEKGEDVHRLVKLLINQYLERLQPTVVFW
jgi:hypothetical protein